MRLPIHFLLHWLCSIVVLGLLITGCTSSNDTTHSQSGSEAGGFSVLSSLAQVPASVEYPQGIHLTISMADMEAAANIAGVRRPEQPHDVDQIFAYLAPMLGTRRSQLIEGERVFSEAPDRIHIVLPELFRTSLSYRDEFVDEYGFRPIEATSFVWVRAPQSLFWVSPGTSQRTDLPELAPGIFTVGQGEDLATNIAERTSVRTLGMPRRLAMRDGQIAVSLLTEPIQAWHDQTGATTLADDPALSRVARILDEQDVVSAYLSRLPTDGYAENVSIVSVTAFGWGEDNEGPFGVVVSSFVSEAAAMDNLAAFTQGFRISESSTLVSIEQQGPDLVMLVRHDSAESLRGSLNDIELVGN